ncbi:hypothetical protein Ancab_018244 [Ancistrocladus abbreviatus]
MLTSNLIVALLIGESKLLAASESPVANFYNKYVERCHDLKRSPSIEEIQKKQDWDGTKDYVRVAEEEEEEEKNVGGDEVGLLMEELNRRVEEFIARVNRQRWLEAHQVLAATSA